MKDFGSGSAKRYMFVGLFALAFGALLHPVGGDLRLFGWTIGLTVAGIFGLSALIIARGERDDDADRGAGSRSGAGAAPIPRPPGKTLAHWTLPEHERSDAAEARWRLDHQAYYRRANVAAWLLGVPVGLFLWWPLGAAYGLPIAMLFAGFVPVSMRLHRWLVGDTTPGEVWITDEGFDAGEGFVAWRDADGDANLLDATLHQGPGGVSLLELVYVRPDPTAAWAPGRALIAVPRAEASRAEALMVELVTFSGEGATA